MVIVLLPRASGIAVGVPDVMEPLLAPRVHVADPALNVAVTDVDAVLPPTPVASNLYNWPFCSVRVEFDNVRFVKRELSNTFPRTTLMVYSSRPL